MKDIIYKKIMDGEQLDIILEMISKLSLASEQDECLQILSSARRISKNALAKDLKKIIKKNIAINVIAGKQNIKIITTPANYIDENIIMLGYSIPLCIENDGFESEEQNVYFIKSKEQQDLILLSQNIFEYQTSNYIIQEKKCPPLHKYLYNIDMQKYSSFDKKPEDIYELIKNILKNYIFFQKEEDYDISTLYIIMTYFYKCFNSIPFLFVYGPKGSGKSQFLNLLDYLCFNSIKCKGITLASFCDTIDNYRGTLIIDQAEDLSNGINKNLNLIGIIADSYNQHGGKRRIILNREKTKRNIEFETYGPKIFASIKDIDEDIRDRCLLINTTRTEKALSKPNSYNQNFINIKQSLTFLYFKYGLDIYMQAKNTQTKNRVDELLISFMILQDFFNKKQELRSYLQQYLYKSVSNMQFELNENERLLFEILFEALRKNPVNNFIKICDKDIKKKFRDFSDNKKISIPWIDSKLKQYGLIHEIKKEKENESFIVNKCYIINRDILIKQYQKYFIDSFDINKIEIKEEKTTNIIEKNDNITKETVDINTEANETETNEELSQLHQLFNEIEIHK